MASGAMLWATMPGREVCGLSLTEMNSMYIFASASRLECICSPTPNMSVLCARGNLIAVVLPCRFLHFGIEFEASSSHLRHDCYLYSILFLLGIHLASGVLVRIFLLHGLTMTFAASQYVHPVV